MEALDDGDGAPLREDRSEMDPSADVGAGRAAQGAYWRARRNGSWAAGAVDRVCGEEAERVSVRPS